MIILLLLLALTSNAYAADISQEYRYQVLVKENVNGIEYKDAIYYTPQEWESLRQADVDTEISKRVTNFDNAIKNPPAPVEPTKEELEDYKAQLEAQVAELSSQIAVARPKAVIDAEKVVALEEIA